MSDYNQVEAESTVEDSMETKISPEEVKQFFENERK